jgi:mono/diheme cytochrome c family protein
MILPAALAFALCCVTPAAPAAPAQDDHRSALAALADVHATVGEIVRIEDGYAVGHAAYVRAAHRALNALVGRRDDGYVAAYGDPGDGVGTLGYIDRMLDQTASFAWTPAVEGAKANVLAAAENLRTAVGDREMEDYEADLTRALANMALAVGRPSQEGVLGGLSGALANTELAVPYGAQSVSGCAPPAQLPAYGVSAGRLVYVALPRSSASASIPSGLDIGRVVVRGDAVVLYTSAARSACRAAAAPARRQLARDVVAAAAPAAAAVPYTTVQAHAGKAVYLRYCLQCHGADLQGTAGPAVAGQEFLSNAKFNGWSLHDVRTTVFQNMPFSNPGSLTPAQYADVMAFLLASSCYPAGTKPFPTADSAALSAVKMAPVAGGSARSKLGTCAVK